MSLYLLVEGDRTEAKLYSRWLPHLVPNIQQIHAPEEAGGNCYLLLRGGGIPQMLDEVKPAVQTIAAQPRFRFLAVALDADEATVAERIAEVAALVDHAALAAANCQLRVLVQNRCIETWLLGNRTFVSPDPNSAKLGEWLRHYNVRVECPEAMPPRASFGNHANTHLSYLQAAFDNQPGTKRYTKREPGHAADPAYLSELRSRTDLFPSHLPTFRTFLELCAELRIEAAAPGDPTAS